MQEPAIDAAVSGSPVLPLAYRCCGGQAHVVPYLHSFATSVKGRWFGRTVADVFSTEFPYYTPEFYRSQVEHGRLVVLRRGKQLAPSEALTQTLRGGDTVRHTVHRHELPVADPGPLRVTGFVPARSLGVAAALPGEGVAAVSKPPTMPVHPCGRYHRNTLTAWASCGYLQRAGETTPADFDAVARALAKDRVHTVHRLDKATSGLVLVATSAAASAAVFALLHRKSQMSVLSDAQGDDPRGDEDEEPLGTEKVYLARVHGRFPGGGAEVKVSRSIYCLSRKAGRFVTVSEVEEQALSRQRRRHASREHNGEGGEAHQNALETAAALRAQALELRATGASAAALEVKKEAQRITTEHGRTGGADCDGAENAKWAATSFRLIRYLEVDDTSLVQCRPVTGRTHQIRLHAALAGHPVVLDAMYGPQLSGAERRTRVQALFNVQASVGETPPAAAAEHVDGCPECAAGDDDDEFWQSFLCLHASTYTLPILDDQGQPSQHRFAVDDPPWV
jgi:23S rRNA-/tRNA-specific pseudouridylate synthase